ncbi:unnamed protein product [Hapterophycus canaliculatus]
MQNGELSAAARVFVPTSISPAKPLPNGGGSGGSTPVRPLGATRPAASAAATPPRPPATAIGSSPVLRSPPGKAGGRGVGPGLGLPLPDVAFGSSWGSMGGGGGGAGNAASSSAADATEDGGGGGGGGGGSSNVWGSLGIDVGGAGVPASGQAIWGGSSLLDSVAGGGGGGSSASAGDGVSLLLAPSTGSAVQAPGDAASLPSFSSSSPLDLSSWGVGGGGGSGAGRQGGGGAALADDEFVGGLASSLPGLSIGGKAGEHSEQQQRGAGFGSSNGLSSWG